MAGIAAACEMILKVRGNLEGLKDTDNSKRTAAHLAAICGQAEVVNFLLERGGKEICRTVNYHQHCHHGCNQIRSYILSQGFSCNFCSAPISLFSASRPSPPSVLPKVIVSLSSVLLIVMAMF